MEHIAGTRRGYHLDAGRVAARKDRTQLVHDTAVKEDHDHNETTKEEEHRTEKTRRYCSGQRPLGSPAEEGRDLKLNTSSRRTQ